MGTPVRFEIDIPIAYFRVVWLVAALEAHVLAGTQTAHVSRIDGGSIQRRRLGMSAPRLLDPAAFTVAIDGRLEDARRVDHRPPPEEPRQNLGRHATGLVARDGCENTRRPAQRDRFRRRLQCERHPRAGRNHARPEASGQPPGQPRARQGEGQAGQRHQQA